MFFAYAFLLYIVFQTYFSPFVINYLSDTYSFEKKQKNKNQGLLGSLILEF